MSFSQIFMFNPAASVAVLGLMAYFLGVAVVFITKPIPNAKSFSMQPVDNAGKTEIRVYYGGISLSLAVFLGVLFAFNQTMLGLIAGLCFSNAVFFIRFIFTFVDKGWKCPYTKLAIPCEGLFIVALWACFIAAAVMGKPIIG